MPIHSIQILTAFVNTTAISPRKIPYPIIRIPAAARTSPGQREVRIFFIKSFSLKSGELLLYSFFPAVEGVAAHDRVADDISVLIDKERFREGLKSADPAVQETFVGDQERVGNAGLFFQKLGFLDDAVVCSPVFTTLMAQAAADVLSAMLAVILLFHNKGILGK